MKKDDEQTDYKVYDNNWKTDLHWIIKGMTIDEVKDARNDNIKKYDNRI